MKRRDNFVASSSRRSSIVREESRQRETEGRRETSNAIASAQNAVDADDCAWVRDHELALPDVRKLAGRFFEWLTENPSRCLAAGFRIRLDRIVRAVQGSAARVASGLPPLAAGARKPRGPRWKRPALPAWMNDPSLLPKRPPTRTEDT